MTKILNLVTNFVKINKFKCYHYIHPKLKIWSRQSSRGLDLDPSLPPLIPGVTTPEPTIVPWVINHPITNPYPPTFTLQTVYNEQFNIKREQKHMRLTLTVPMGLLTSCSSYTRVLRTYTQMIYLEWMRIEYNRKSLCNL